MKKSQMNEVKAKCASSTQSTASWNSIDWDKCEQWVRKLQLRIAKAQKEKRHNKVNALQHLLVTSFYAKALAVKRVTSNKGKRTAGVDKVKWTTPVDQSKAIADLKRRGYHSHPLKRVYIAKSNGKKRPLGIPTMKDRAMQALYLMALEPITETMADANSYGFRRKRSTADAIDTLHRWLSRSCSPEWLLEGDIKGCFDNTGLGARMNLNYHFNSNLKMSLWSQYLFNQNNDPFVRAINDQPKNGVGLRLEFNPNINTKFSIDISNQEYFINSNKSAIQLEGKAGFKFWTK